MLWNSRGKHLVIYVSGPVLLITDLVEILTVLKGNICRWRGETPVSEGTDFDTTPTMSALVLPRDQSLSLFASSISSLPCRLYTVSPVGSPLPRDRGRQCPFLFWLHSDRHASSTFIFQNQAWCQSWLHYVSLSHLYISNNPPIFLKCSTPECHYQHRPQKSNIGQALSWFFLGFFFCENENMDAKMIISTSKLDYFTNVTLLKRIALWLFLTKSYKDPNVMSYKWTIFSNDYKMLHLLCIVFWYEWLTITVRMVIFAFNFPDKK